MLYATEVTLETAEIGHFYYELPYNNFDIQATHQRELVLLPVHLNNFYNSWTSFPFKKGEEALEMQNMEINFEQILEKDYEAQHWTEI